MYKDNFANYYIFIIASSSPLEIIILSQFRVLWIHCHIWSIYWIAEWKNWCFWTVVLEKTLESPLDCKEIQPVHSKGDQSWVFFGRTDAETETPVLHYTSVDKESDTTEQLNWTELRCSVNEIFSNEKWFKYRCQQIS